MKRTLHVAAMIFPILALSATTVQGATVFTGETIQDARVISQLDLADLAPGKMHRFMFRGAETATGQYWYVPVLVAKGAKPGKRILFVAGVHGDELNPIAAVQATFATLDPANMTGSAIAIIGPVDRAWKISPGPGRSTIWAGSRSTPTAPGLAARTAMPSSAIAG